MGTLNAGIVKIKKLTEKERLELIEKKVEIQKNVRRLGKKSYQCKSLSLKMKMNNLS
jgi:hypothetical protein